MLAVIEVVSVRRERLSDITPEAVRREGFDLTPAEFVALFCKAAGCEPDAIVTVITFRYVGSAECEYCYGSGVRFWHTQDCRSDDCVLAGGYDDCAGLMQRCPCTEERAA